MMMDLYIDLCTDDKKIYRRGLTLDSRRCDDGKYILDGSLTKPYIKTEKPGKVNKWVTFYALLAEKYRG